MKIDKIIFNNFRNYQGKQIFELNKYITVLYGDNGNGKSSFFDGIEWCLTGVIARFSDKKPPKEALANKNINVKEECFVEIYFSSYCIKRSFARSDNGFSNVDISLFSLGDSGSFRKIANGEDNVDLALRRIFEKEGIKYRDIKYKVGEIINKAYILSQDQVADFVTRDKPNERYSALASIMGFERVLKLRKNLSNTIKCFKESLEALKSDKSNLIEKEKELNRELKQINYEIIEKFKSIYNFEPENSTDIEMELKKLQSELFTIEQQYKDIEQLNFIKVDNIKEVNIILNKKNEQVLSIEKSLKECLIEENQLNQEILKIKKAVSRLSENEKINSDFLEINKRLVELSNELNNLNINEKNLQNLKEAIRGLHRKSRIIEFAKQNREEYDNAKLFLKEFDRLIVNKRNILHEQQGVLETLSQNKQLIENDLLKVDENSSLNSLIKSIEDIYYYVNQNDVNDVCPVCLSNVDNNLKTKISINLNELVEEAGNKKDIVVRKIKSKEEIEIKEAQQKNSIQSLEYEIKSLEIQNKVSRETVEYIEGSDLFSNYLTLTKENFAHAEIYSIQQLNNYQAALKICEQIQSYEEKLKNLHLDKNLLGIDAQALNSKVNVLEDKLTALRKLILEKEQEISVLNSEIFKIKNLKTEFETYFTNYSVSSIFEVRNVLDGQRIKFQDSLNLLKSLLPIIEDRHYNQGINNEILKVTRELETLSGKITNVLEKTKVIEDILSKLDSEYGEEATDFLNSNRSTIQTYYRYLNPTPSQFNNLYFEVDNNEELYIKIAEDRKKNDENSSYYADANMILSSGQLNVLALSIFIATNEAQSCSYFDFIAIDDPIQNMDDINRFSICDVLSQLNRQLIFSTHDQEFLNLFLKKNEYQIDKVTLYTLNSDDNQYLPLTLI
ncbi:AAA family ATPase [Bacillus mycoides]